MLSEQNIIEYRNLLIKRKNESFDNFKRSNQMLSMEELKELFEKVNYFIARIEVLNYIIQTNDDTFNKLPF